MDRGLKVSFIQLVKRHIKLHDLEDVGERYIGAAFEELDAKRVKTKENLTGTPMVSEIYKLALILQASPPAQEE